MGSDISSNNNREPIEDAQPSARKTSGITADNDDQEAKNQ